MNYFDEMHHIIGEIRKANDGDLTRSKDKHHARRFSKLFLTSYGRLKRLAELEGLNIQKINPANFPQVEHVVDEVLNVVEKFELELAIQTGVNEIQSRVEQNFVSLTKSQVEEIEAHIKNAREKIRDTKTFEEKHKRHLLVRLEKLQSEINKKISDLDVMLAGVAEVTVVAGQSAKNLNPVVEIFQKIFQVADRGSEEPLSLPPPPKQITNQSSELESGAE